MKHIRTLLIGLVTLLSISTLSHASDAQDKALGINCMPAKDFVKLLGKLDSLDASKKDTVSMIPTMQFEVNDGGVFPQRVFFRNGDVENPFHLDKTGVVTDFTNIKTMSKKGEMCMQDKTRIDQPEDSDDLNLSIEMDLLYKNNTGVYSLAELEDGLKDGRSHIKKIVPVPVRLLIPKFTHLEVNIESGDTVHIAAMRGGAEISGLYVTELDGSKVVEYAQLVSLGAEQLKITGDKFTLGPMPSPEEIEKMESED